MSGIHTRWLLGKFSILLGPQREYKQACKEVHEVIEKYIDRAICKQKSGISKHSSDEAPRTCVLLDDLVAAGVDRAEIRDQVLGVFFPARDSTALGISNIFFYLARHPRAWNTLRSEILAIDQPLTFEYLKSLKFLRYVINEGMRRNLLVFPLVFGTPNSSTISSVRLYGALTSSQLSASSFPPVALSAPAFVPPSYPVVVVPPASFPSWSNPAPRLIPISAPCISTPQSGAKMPPLSARSDGRV